MPFQPLDEGVHESLKTPLTIERSLLEEALQHHGPVDERKPGGRQTEIRPQGGEEGLASEIAKMRVHHCTERCFVVAKELRKAPRHPHHVPEGQLRRKFAHLAIQRGAEFEESAQSLRLAGKVANVRGEKVFGDGRALTGDGPNKQIMVLV